MFRRVVLLLVVSTLVISGCGGSSQESDSTTTLAPRISDTTRVKNLTLRTSDLPLGFAAIDARTASMPPMISECVSGLFASTATHVGEVFLRGSHQVASQSYAMQTPQAATITLASLTDGGVQGCLSEMVRSRFEALKLSLGVTEPSRPIEISAPDPSTARYRASTDTSTKPASLTLLITQGERSISAVWFWWIEGTPTDEFERGVITALRARAVATFNDSFNHSSNE
jgi:hypothetical protein